MNRWRERQQEGGDGGGVGLVVLPITSVPSLIGLGFEVKSSDDSGEPRVLCLGPSPILYSAGDGGPPAIWAGRPRSGRVQGVRPDLWIGPVEINSNIHLLFKWHSTGPILMRDSVCAQVPFSLVLLQPYIMSC